MSKTPPIKNKITPIIISIFSGRIADCGVDPVNVVRYAIKSFKNFNNVKILWASTREVFNYYQAKNLGCHIITMSPDLIHKFYKKKIALDIYSLQTVRQFFLDGKKSKFSPTISKKADRFVYSFYVQLLIILSPILIFLQFHPNHSKSSFEIYSFIIFYFY